MEEAFGLDLYEMDLRQYDPAIARWTGIDPVTHHTMSTYTAFDNNPVYWTDPSGADGETAQQYEDRVAWTIGASVYETTFTAGNGNIASVVHDGNNIESATIDINGASGSLKYAKDSEIGFKNTVDKSIKQIATTLIGYEVTFALTNSLKDYMIKETGDIKNSKFTFQNRTIHLGVDSKFIDGVMMTNLFVTGHEFYHAYQFETLPFNQFLGLTDPSNGLKALEKQAVGFENYLRASFGESTMRNKYTQNGTQYNVWRKNKWGNIFFSGGDNWNANDFLSKRIYQWRNYHKEAYLNYLGVDAISGATGN